ncbi:MAG: hypothetical protein KAI81_03760, partial [Candidatus Marinimicrobia bacterium]|nr:hypothetical protein [Candidatus Neomarinimicrobiota bacterium]
MKKKIISIILLMMSLSVPLYSGQTEIWLKSDKQDDALLVGDVVTFSVSVDVQSNSCTGAICNLTFDPIIFKPVFHEGVPFKSGTFSGYSWVANETNDDVWADPYVDKNGIGGFQIGYAELTKAASVPGGRLTVSGQGLLATFKLEVLKIPDIMNPETGKYESIIRFDNVNIGSRNTGYFLLDGVSSSLQNFNTMRSLTVSIEGAGIYPDLSDSLLVPGEDISIFLGDHYIGTEFDSTQAIWTYDTLNTPNNTVFSIDTVNNADMLTFNTEANSHGQLDVNIFMNTPEGKYKDTTLYTVIVDHIPVITANSFTFDEDVATDFTKADLFTDADDDNENITISMENSDSLIFLN